MTEFPQGILAIFSIIFEESNFHHNVYMKLGDLMDIFALINNSINFVLYCSMSRTFRKTFKKVLINMFCNNYFIKDSSLKRAVSFAGSQQNVKQKVRNSLALNNNKNYYVSHKNLPNGMNHEKVVLIQTDK